MPETSLLFRVALGLLGVALIVISVCRLQHMTARTTLARVRRAGEAVLATGALMVLAATVRPDWTRAALLASPMATLAWMAATSHAWRHGQPQSVARSGAVMRRSRWTAAAHTRPTWQETRPMADKERWRA